LSPLRLLLAALLASLCAAPALAQKSGTVILPGGDSRAPVSIDAARLEYFDKEQKLVYSGGVVAKQGDSVMRAAALTIFMNSGAMQGGGASVAGENQVKRMEAAGPVTIISKDQVGMGDRAVYDKDGDKVLLIGNVSLSQGGNIIKGKADSRLIYDLKTSQAIIEGAGGINSLMTPGSGEDPAQKGRPAAARGPKTQ
jgi:lipopolysaccharide export system protein LptA